MQQSKFAEARDLIERLIKQRPVFGLYEMSKTVALKQKDYRAAVRYAEKAVELEERGSFKFHVSLHFDLAFAYAQLQQDEAAAEQFELILKFTQKDKTAFLERRVQVHNHLGSLRARQNKFDLAVVQFKESLKLDGKQPNILHTLAKILMNCPNPALSDPYKAVELARQACELTRSENPMYLNTLAVAYFNIKNYTEAVKNCEKALALVQAQCDQALADKLREQLALIKRVAAESK